MLTRSSTLDPSEPVCEKNALHAISVLWARAAALSWPCGAYAGRPSDSLAPLISNNKSLSNPELPIGLQPGKPVAVGGGVTVNVEVGGGPPNGVFEGVGVGLEVEVFEGVSVIVGVAVMVEVGVGVSGRNGVAVGTNVGVALGSGEGSAGAPNDSDCPRGTEIPETPASVGVLGTNEPMGDCLARSIKPARPAALEE